VTVALQVAVLTVSDTRTPETDTSGAFLADALVDAGHTVSDRQLVIDDIYQLRATVSQWIADPAIEVVLVTGGTGFRVAIPRRKHSAPYLISLSMALERFFGL